MCRNGFRSERGLACVFETDTGYLRPVKIGGVEVLRTIYGAVRDRNWDTVLPVIELERAEQGEDDFLLEFTARCDLTPISFLWKGTVHAQGESLEFRFEGQARSTFLRNRIGLCILHPIKECAGKPCRIQHSDGTWGDGEFPLYISPHQPFKDLRALSWSPSHGVSAEILFEGDVFETEDQRNWTDASYKTYSTPLELPFPVEVACGERISQRVALSLKMQHEKPTAVVEEARLSLTVSSIPLAKPLPKIGLGVATHGLPLSENERQCLARLRLNHLRVDVHFSQSDWKRAGAQTGS
jgi:D-apionolactonase